MSLHGNDDESVALCAGTPLPLHGEQIRAHRGQGAGQLAASGFREIAHDERVQLRPHSLRGLQGAAALAREPNALDAPVFAREFPACQPACFESIDESAQRDFAHLEGGGNFTLVHSPAGMSSEMGEHGKLGSRQPHGFGLLIEGVPPEACHIVNQGADGHGAAIDRHGFRNR